MKPAAKRGPYKKHSGHVARCLREKRQKVGDVRERFPEVPPSTAYYLAKLDGPSFQERERCIARAVKETVPTLARQERKYRVGEDKLKKVVGPTEALKYLKANWGWLTRGMLGPEHIPSPQKYGRILRKAAAGGKLPRPKRTRKKVMLRNHGNSQEQDTALQLTNRLLVC